MRARLFPTLSLVPIMVLVGIPPATAFQSFLPRGVYDGGYMCAQGATRLRLVANRRTARFEFGGNDGLPTGAYTVEVRTERDGTIVLTPQAWLSRPSGYVMVGARLRREGDALIGTITNPNCGEISLFPRGARPAGQAE